jgi:hypothetical protein
LLRRGLRLPLIPGSGRASDETAKLSRVAQRASVSPDSLIPKVLWVKRTYGGEGDGRDHGCIGGSNERAIQLW